MRCEVVAVGTELLLGQIVDTNSAWIGEHHFNLLGVNASPLAILAQLAGATKKLRLAPAVYRSRTSGHACRPYACAGRFQRHGSRSFSPRAVTVRCVA